MRFVTHASPDEDAAAMRPPLKTTASKITKITRLMKYLRRVDSLRQRAGGENNPVRRTGMGRISEEVDLES